MTTMLSVNDQDVSIDAPPDMPLLWALREHRGLTGTKYGCGIGQCGACTVHLDGAAVRACLTPLAAAAGKRVVTIEGLSQDGAHPLQKAWIAEDVSQCGYCQSGMIMAASALLAQTPAPNDDDLRRALTNICRCGTYQRIRAAISTAAAELRGETA
jgi:isoquinoline 1-oxidoreductase subunit alpha